MTKMTNVKDFIADVGWVGLVGFYWNREFGLMDENVSCSRNGGGGFVMQESIRLLM